MPNQPCPGILEVAVNYLYDQQRISTIFHVDNDTGEFWEATEITAVLDAIEGVFWPAVQPLVPPTVSFVEVIGTDLTSLDGRREVRPITPVEVGSNASPGLPANATMAIHLAVPTRGRGSSGRVFWPVLVEAEVTTNTVSATYADAAIDSIAALETAINGLPGTQHLCVLSRRLNGALRPEGIGRPIVGIGVVDRTVDSQRTRLPGHKRKKAPVGP